VQGQSALNDFIRAACVPRAGSHAEGTLDDARRILAQHSSLPRESIHAAAIVGDDEQVRHFIAGDAAAATRAGGPYGWDPLTHLCFSRYLRLERDRSAAFARAAEALLDAGADPNAGFSEPGNAPTPEWECLLYGAAGVAHDAAVTRLLVARGADVNDAEVTYHAPETQDNAALAVLIESGKLTADSLATMLLRKADWHDVEGVRMLLDAGAEPNRPTHWGNTALQHAVARDNGRDIVALMIDHGGDPALSNDGRAPSSWGRGRTPVAMAAWNGRRDLLELFDARGVRAPLDGVEALLAACASGDDASITRITSREPAIVSQLRTVGGDVLASFARVGNADGLRRLLDLGVDAAATTSMANGYWDIADRSTALHAAAWLGRHEAVKALLERGAPADAQDARGRTPLALAVKACVDSYWTGRRSPESVDALLRAGANPHTPGVMFPSGYAEVDTLLSSARVSS